MQITQKRKMQGAASENISLLGAAREFVSLLSADAKKNSTRGVPLVELK